MNGQSVADYGMKLESIVQKDYETGIINPEVRNYMFICYMYSGRQMVILVSEDSN